MSNQDYFPGKVPMKESQRQPHLDFIQTKKPEPDFIPAEEDKKEVPVAKEAIVKPVVLESPVKFTARNRKRRSTK
jgi:hypothetical protein